MRADRRPGSSPSLRPDRALPVGISSERSSRGGPLDLLLSNCRPDCGGRIARCTASSRSRDLGFAAGLYASYTGITLPVSGLGSTEAEPTAWLVGSRSTSRLGDVPSVSGLGDSPSAINSHRAAPSLHGQAGSPRRWLVHAHLGLSWEKTASPPAPLRATAAPTL